MQLILEEWRRCNGDRRYQGMMPHIISPIGDQYEVRRNGSDIVLTIEPAKRERFNAQNELYAKRAKYSPFKNRCESLKVSVTQPCDPPELEYRMSELAEAEKALDNLITEIGMLQAIVDSTPATVEIVVSAADVAAMQFQL